MDSMDPNNYKSEYLNPIDDNYKSADCNGDPRNNESKQNNDQAESADCNADPKSNEPKYLNQNNDQTESADYKNSPKSDDQNNDVAKFSESKDQENVRALKLIIRYKKELG